MSMHKILVLNLGGTSSKISLYEDEKCVASRTLHFTAEEIAYADTSRKKVELNVQRILEWFEIIHAEISDVDAFAVRLGGTFYGGDGGTFLVEGALRRQVDQFYHADEPPFHGTRMCMAIVDRLCEQADRYIPSYVTDPSSIDQLIPEAKLTGCTLLVKRAAFHALNQKAVARKAAAEMGKKYDDCNIIVIHAGAGISVGAHYNGRVIDVNDASEGDGPFTPNRAGGVPAGSLLRLCYSGKYSEDEMYSYLRGNGGLMGYLGTADLIEIDKRIDGGDEYAALILSAMAYQICREALACFATLCGEVDAIALTGGMIHSDRLFGLIESRIGKMAPIYRYPGEFENEALAYGALRVLRGEEKVAEYTGEHGHIQVPK